MIRNADSVGQPGPAFWSKVRIADCWEWQAEISHSGYGIWYPGRPRYGTRYVHKIAWLALMGAVPDGHEVDHMCWVRHCVNPAHMRILTLAENRQIGRRNWLYRTAYCAEGHLKAGPNLIVTKQGWHRCRECARAATRAYEARGRVPLGVSRRASEQHIPDTHTYRDSE